MIGGKDANDKTILKNVTQKLACGGQNRTTVTVRAGTVTLTGVLQYEAQRRVLTKLVTRVAGVRQVVDQMRVLPRIQQNFDRIPAKTTPADTAPTSVPAPAELASEEVPEPESPAAT